MTSSARDIANLFEAPGAFEIPSRFNIAPTQDVVVVRQIDDQRRLDLLRWGLVPRWAKDLSIGYKTFNARSETAHEKPSFKAAFKSRRCLIPADGFYEWDKVGGQKQPYYIRRKDHQPMAFAGLWEEWAKPDGGEIVESCTILTTSANQDLSRIHQRMPVILRPDQFTPWLGQAVTVSELSECCKPSTDQLFELIQVTSYVNKTSHDGPQCVEPYAHNC